MVECVYATSKPACENAIFLIRIIKDFPWTQDEKELIKEMMDK